MQNFEKIYNNFAYFLQNFTKSCRFWKMLKNAILDAKNCEDFAEIWQKIDKNLTKNSPGGTTSRRSPPRSATRSGGACSSISLRRSQRRREPDGLLTISLSDARSRLDRRRFSRPNTHFAAFLKLYKKIIFSRANLQNCAKFHGFAKILRIFLKISEKMQKFTKFYKKFAEFFTEFCKTL